jgi:hypothetical protein
LSIQGTDFAFCTLTPSNLVSNPFGPIRDVNGHGDDFVGVRVVTDNVQR